MKGDTTTTMTTRRPPTTEGPAIERSFKRLLYPFLHFQADFRDKRDGGASFHPSEEWRG